MTDSNLAKGGGRKSNIEALRLLCMFMVLNLHSFWGYEHGCGVLQILDFFRESLCICAVDVFLIISGFFGIKWKFKSLWNLTFQLFFYAFGVYVVAACIGTIDFNTHDFLMNAQALYACWGFMTGYLLLWFCSPFLNVFSDNTSSRTLLITIVLLIFVEWAMCRDNHFLNYGLMYLIGRFLNKTNAPETLSIDSGKCYLITTVIITVIVYFLYKFTHYNTAVLVQASLFGYNYAAPLVILQSVFLFLTFARMKFQNKVINWMSASCLSIFLIHMHPAIKEIYYYNYTESLYTLPLLLHIVKLSLLIVVVFFGSILIDKIRICISNLLFRLLHMIKRLLPQKIFVADTFMPKSIKNII